MNEGFHFHTQYALVELLGREAASPGELLEGIKRVPVTSIYYHTHEFLKKHHFLVPQPPNDFVLWLKDILHLERLAEAFLGVDTITFHSLEDLRAEFVRILEDDISAGEFVARCPQGYEFQFMACRTFVLPTPYVAHNLAEFGEVLHKIGIHSLYFHIFEARIRLGTEENDFSAWLTGIGEEALARDISQLDPYYMTLENLRSKLIRMVERRVQGR
jgi:hypothetical protein